MTKKLLPCPFCASHDVELRESITDAYVACNNCGCRTGFVFLGASDPSNANKLIEVAEVWNTRPEPVADEPVAWMYHKPGGSPYIRDIPPEEAKWQFGVTPLYEHPPTPDQAQPIDDEGLVEEIARALYDANHAGLSNCYLWDDHWEDHQEAQRGRYYKEARAILPIIRECLK